MFDNLTDDELIIKVLSSSLYCPCLILGGYVSIFKKHYNDQVFQVYNIETVKDIVGRFSGISDLDDRYLVVDGVGHLNDYAQNSLLKFLEESTIPIFLLSYFDRISPVIKSRVKFTFKKPLISCKSLNFNSVNQALRMLEERKEGDKEFTYMDEVKFLAKTSPTALVQKHLNPKRDSNQYRILKLINNL